MAGLGHQVCSLFVAKVWFVAADPFQLLTHDFHESPGILSKLLSPDLVDGVANFSNSFGRFLRVPTDVFGSPYVRRRLEAKCCRDTHSVRIGLSKLALGWAESGRRRC